MQHKGIANTMLWFLAAVGVLATMYFVAGIARGAWRIVQRHGKVRWGKSTTATIDEHIVGQWTEGRQRLDSLLKLIGKIGALRGQDVDSLRHLDHADPLYEREARGRIAPNLRRFAFDKHLRDECRMLVSLLQFCGKDLPETQGLDTAAQFSALASFKSPLSQPLATDTSHRVLPGWHPVRRGPGRPTVDWTPFRRTSDRRDL